MLSCLCKSLVYALHPRRFGTGQCSDCDTVSLSIGTPVVSTVNMGCGASSSTATESAPLKEGSDATAPAQPTGAPEATEQAAKAEPAAGPDVGKDVYLGSQ